MNREVLEQSHAFGMVSCLSIQSYSLFVLKHCDYMSLLFPFQKERTFR